MASLIVKLWSVGSKDPIMTFPSDKTVSSIAFEVVGPSIDFDGNYMLVGSARPHKNLLLYGMKTNTTRLPLIASLISLLLYEMKINTTHFSEIGFECLSECL